MEIKKNAKNAQNFNCINCDFSCCKKSDFVRHLSTRKHFLSHNGNDLEIKKAPKNAAPYECLCGKKYKSISGLWKHSKICIHVTDNPNTNKEITPELILSVLQQNKDLQSLILEQNKTIVDLAKNSNNSNNLNNSTNSNNINSNNINSHNKSFNLQFFLNETCKDAMNIMDFVDSLKIQLSDLEKVGEIGYVNGISNIIVKNLKSLDVNKRPVHCADAKREILYVKDENKWEKEGEENAKLRKAIQRVAYKNSKMLSEFRKEHPDCGKSESKYSDQYNKLIVESMGGGVEKENKIIKNIAKEVVIQK